MRLLRGRQLEAGPRDCLSDWNAVAALAGRERPQGDAYSAGLAGETLLGAGTAVHHVC